jgi:hypothetical protein
MPTMWTQSGEEINMKPISAFNSLPLAARRAILMFGVAGLIAAVYTFLYQPTLSPERILVLLALAAVTARAKVKLYKDTSLSFLTSVVLLAVITQGPAVAVAVAVFGVTVQSFWPKRRLVLHQAIFNAGMISVTVTATWWIHHVLTAALPLPQLSAETTATVLASFTYFLGNSVSVSLMVALSKGMSMFQVWATHFMYSAPSFLIAGMLSVGLIALAGSASLWIIAAVIPVVAFPYYCSVRLTSQTAK